MIRAERLKEYNKVIAWGTGNTFKMALSLGVIKFDCAVDSNSAVWGTVVEGLNVISPKELIKEEDAAIVICSTAENEIYQHIRSMGISMDVYYTSMIYPNPIMKCNYYNCPEMIVEDSKNARYSNEKNVQILIALMKLHNIHKVVISPGSANVCLVASLQNDNWFELYSDIDERSAAYMACGLAKESNEIVALSCTGATASRNYLPGLTEAYYSNLPVLAITSSQYIGKVDMGISQVTDRSCPPKDAVKYSVHISEIHTREEEYYAQILINKAILEMNHSSRGPVHINIETHRDLDTSWKALPSVRKIDRLTMNDHMPEIKDGVIGIFIGNHCPISNELEKLIDEFCYKYNAIVLCDQTSNYYGKYKVMAQLMLNQQNGVYSHYEFDLIIHFGGISGNYINLNTKAVWRIDESGRFFDTFERLRYIFEMKEVFFFKEYLKKGFSGSNYISYIDQWNTDYNRLLSSAKLPFSNIWIAQQSINKIPDGSIVHLSILNSLRSWSMFHAKKGIVFYSNTGGFGIDGTLSTLMGTALASQDRLHYCIIGDLAFFYDMNALGNRDFPNNVRILLINNDGGAEFRFYDDVNRMILGEDVDLYTAAKGHFACKKKKITCSVAESLGFKYFCCDNKTSFKTYSEVFFDETIGDAPIVFETVISPENESIALDRIVKLDTGDGL